MKQNKTLTTVFSWLQRSRARKVLPKKIPIGLVEVYGSSRVEEVGVKMGELTSVSHTHTGSVDW